MEPEVKADNNPVSRWLQTIQELEEKKSPVLTHKHYPTIIVATRERIRLIHNFWADQLRIAASKITCSSLINRNSTDSQASYFEYDPGLFGG